jgi:hypothetical protein
MQPCFRVGVLAWETQRRVGGRVAVPGGGATERAAGVPGDVAGLVDEFGGGADQVGDDGEEAGVDLVLAERLTFVLRQRSVTVVVPGDGDTGAGFRLFREAGSIPSEVGRLDG